MNDVPFIILYEDDDFLAINKPSGITVNNSDTTRNQQTVQDWSEKYLNISIVGHENDQTEFYKRGGIVHRLDKETSGILLIAKNPEAFSNLQLQFKERNVQKKYVALAHGVLTPSSGVIALPVGRLPWNRKQFGIIAGGRPSETTYETIGTYSLGRETLSLLQLYPKTGRTHQIRVHLKYLNHPIVSDFLYAGRKTARKDRVDLPRVFLHASELTIPHPRTHEPVRIVASLPDDLTTYLQTLSKHQS